MLLCFNLSCFNLSFLPHTGSAYPHSAVPQHSGKYAGSVEHLNITCSGDLELQENGSSADMHQGSSRKAESKDDLQEYIRGVVYGGLDGVLTIFALLASAVGSELSIRSLAAMGIANVLADGLSMGFGGYVSSKSEVERNQSVREKVGAMSDELVEDHLKSFYLEKGISDTDAAALLSIFRKYPIIMKERYCAEIEGVLPVDEDSSPVTEGKITFQSFLLFGSLPLLPIIVALIFPNGDSQNVFNGAISISILFTILTLGALGLTKARLSGQPPFTQVGLMISNGVLCAGVSFLVSFGSGEALEMILGVHNNDKE